MANCFCGRIATPVTGVAVASVCPAGHISFPAGHPNIKRSGLDYCRACQATGPAIWVLDREDMSILRKCGGGHTLPMGSGHYGTLGALERNWAGIK